VSRKFPATPTLDDLYNTVIALKQAVEILTAQRLPINNAAVTWQDLLNVRPIPLVTEQQLPKPSD
jgi:hypothetical protein